MSHPSPLCSREQQRELLEAIRGGNYHEPACASVGVSFAAFKSWMVHGEGALDGPYRAFYEDVRKAEASHERELVDTFNGFAKTDWRANASLAARRYPQRWAEQGPRREGPDGGVVIRIGIALGTGEAQTAIDAPRWTEVPQLPAGDD